MLSAVLSVLLPGLGHVYAGRFARALIWLAGAIAIAAVMGDDPDLRVKAIALEGVVGLFAAVDVCLLLRAAGLGGRGR